MFKFLFAIVLIACATAAYAAEESRQSLIVEIVRVTNLSEMFDASVKRSEKLLRQNVEQMMSKLLGRPGLDSSKKARAQQIMEEYVESLEFVSADDMVEAWARHYGQGLSDSDLREILNYYKSPVGQKDVAATIAAQAAFNAEIGQKQTRNIQSAVDGLIVRLNQELAK